MLFRNPFTLLELANLQKGLNRGDVQLFEKVECLTHFDLLLQEVEHLNHSWTGVLQFFFLRCGAAR